MCAKLEMEVIAANSPQAKGRVERNHGTHQDRLVKKLRRQNIDSDEQANGYLEAEYLPEQPTLRTTGSEAGGLSPSGPERGGAGPHLSFGKRARENAAR